MRLILARNFLLAALAISLAGCGAKSNPPTGPDSGIPPFTVSLVPGEITPPQNAQVKLFAIFPEQFNQLDGKQAYFSSTSGNGFFSIDSSRVDVQTFDQSNLNPSVWYAYNGTQSNLWDTVKVEIVDIYGNTLSWNFGTILIH